MRRLDSNWTAGLPTGLLDGPTGGKGSNDWEAILTSCDNRPGSQ